MNKQSSILAVVGLSASVAFGSGNTPGVWNDTIGDAAIRRTDVGNDAQLPMDFTPIDLNTVRLEGWNAFTPSTDPYNGAVITSDSDFMRMQIIVEGLVCPPGPLALDGSPYHPTEFGQRPVYGYFEMDIDNQIDTGGELMPVARNRYLANVGRFGMSPMDSISERIVRDGNDIDSNFFSDPQFERSGGEFSLLLCGCFEPTIVSQDGNNDSIFDEGETWVLSGRFFERMESFAPESALFGGSAFGQFDPVVNIQFAHDPILDQTTITLVFPITNAGSAAMLGQVEQPLDLNITNQTSIEEALEDLIEGADFATGPLAILVEDWEDRAVTSFRRPRQWDVSAIVGTAPVVADPTALFIWTDTGFNEIFGDLNDDNQLTIDDSQIIEDFINDNDGTILDADGKINGQVAILNFGFEFNIADLNGDGVIARDDIIISLCPADINGDGTLNFFDVSAFLSAFGMQDPVADFNGDGTFNFFDVSAFLSAFSAGCS